MKTCIVSVSGGAASALALERVLRRFKGRVIPVFADTKCEDADLYRFLKDIERVLKVEIVRLADGRDVWELFFDERFIGNTRVDICSRILKRDLIRKFVQDHPAESTVLAFGMGPAEITRSQRLCERWAPYQVWNPLQQPPFLGRCEILDHLIDQWDIDPPRLYEEGFKHNNCGGACVKAGHGAWAHLLRKRPKTYAEWERKEQEFREKVNANAAILRDRRGGITRPMTLRELRRRLEAGYDPKDQGEACNCMGN